MELIIFDGHLVCQSTTLAGVATKAEDTVLAWFGQHQSELIDVTLTTP